MFLNSILPPLRVELWSQDERDQEDQELDRELHQVLPFLAALSSGLSESKGNEPFQDQTQQAA